MTFEDWQEQDIEQAAELEVDTGAMSEDGRWTIEDDLTADWALRKIREMDEISDRKIALARSYIAHYQAEIEREEERKARNRGFLLWRLAEYFGRLEHRVTKSGIEKYDLLSGRLIRKPATQKIVKASEEELITWCAASGQSRFIKRVEKVDWAGLKKKLAIIGDEVVDSQSGEVVAGCTIEEVPEEFKVEVS